MIGIKPKNLFFKVKPNSDFRRPLLYLGIDAIVGWREWRGNLFNAKMETWVKIWKFPQMISSKEIQSFSQKIVEEFQPEQVILFGSYAYGQATQDSDVDLLVILPFEGLPVYKAIEIRKKLKPTFSLDLITRTSKQIQQRLDMGDFFIKDILQKGHILYETNHRRVGY